MTGDFSSPITTSAAAGAAIPIITRKSSVNTPPFKERRAWQWPKPIWTPASCKFTTIEDTESSKILNHKDKFLANENGLINHKNNDKFGSAASLNSIAADEPDYLKLILTARVYDTAIETPLTYARKLSTKLKNSIYFKREDMQPEIFSFKCRGAFNRMYNLSKEERERGVCCCSAGNHAQGVALAAQKLGIRAVIVMPKFAPDIKVSNVRRLGGEVVLEGYSLEDAKAKCKQLVAEQNLVFIPPFDDPYIIAGQGTAGVEILRQLRQDRLDAIFVCCGGGGLLSGIAAYVKRIRPEIKIIGVNTIDSDCMFQSLKKGEVVELPNVGIFADGTAIKQVGYETHRLCAKFVDDFVLVNNDEVCAAIKDAFDDTRVVLEPSGALAIAGMKRYLQENSDIQGGVFCAVTSGANMNFSRLGYVVERCKIGEGTEALISALIKEEPGSLHNLYDHVYPYEVTELAYRFNPNSEDNARRTAHIFFAIQVGQKEDTQQLIESLNKDKVVLEALDISNNELAKEHSRHMVGGRSPSVKNEKIFRFTFAERPGALKNFLNVVATKWDISIFHYRNNGSDMGRVLVGFQLDSQNEKELYDMLDSLGRFSIQYVEETYNPVYKHFLK